MLVYFGVSLSALLAKAEAHDPSGARLWTRADLESLDRILIDRMGNGKTAFTQVLDGGRHGVLVLHREVTADPELHVGLNDFFVVTGGAGEIRIGGNVTGARIIKPDEKLGTTLQGGTLYPVRQGDVLFIPANVWHQVIVAKGEALSAILIKAQ